MPPIRRYLRISKYSILECRIYLDNPSDTRWLLNVRDQVLQRIFAAIRPLILPKLREENERLMAKKRGNPVKDVIAEDEFEVALFLRESHTRHSLLTRQKTFEEPEDAGGKTVDRSASTADAGILLESDDEEADLDLHNIPPTAADEGNDAPAKRLADESNASPETQRTSKRRKRKQAASQIDEDEGDEKKLKFRTNYESFNIYGWVLCLLVTRKGDTASKDTSEPKSQVLMEEWMSTQAQGNLEE